MNRTQETRKTGLRLQRPERLALAIARPTFDLAYARKRWRAAQRLLDAEGFALYPESILEAAQLDALFASHPQAPKQLVIFQATFADASLVKRIADQWPETQLILWAPREPRSGERLRLNAICGLHLASHALSRMERPLRPLVLDPEADSAAPRLAATLSAPPLLPRPLAPPASPSATDSAAAQSLIAALKGLRIGLVGEAPDGFDSCHFDPDWLADILGVEVVSSSLERLFSTARAVPEARLDALEADTRAKLEDYDRVDAGARQGTLSFYQALHDWVRHDSLDALAVRCWPEIFTELGCAACGAMARLGEAGIPSACEADVGGTLSSYILQQLSQSPPFLVDLVDQDPGDDTAVVWHCGLAPLSLCAKDAKPRATLHSNRRLPLLQEFPLKAGRITLFRISFGWGRPFILVGTSEMRARPLAFSGTAGVLDLRSEQLVALFAQGVEHHLAFAYGDHKAALVALAAALELPLLDLDGFRS